MEFRIIITLCILVSLCVHLSSECRCERAGISIGKRSIGSTLTQRKVTFNCDKELDQSALLTMDQIKMKLKESGIFDTEDGKLNDRERKELNKLFDGLDILTISQKKQTPNHQNTLTSLRLVERAIKNQVKDGQFSETLAAKFHWDRILNSTNYGILDCVGH